jgi:hypothetical protein
MKTLTYDLTRILRLSLVMFDNDTTGCFDRIIISLAMIAALRLGMPCSAAHALVSTTTYEILCQDSTWNFY